MDFRFNIIFANKSKLNNFYHNRRVLGNKNPSSELDEIKVVIRIKNSVWEGKIRANIRTSDILNLVLMKRTMTISVCILMF